MQEHVLTAEIRRDETHNRARRRTAQLFRDPHLTPPHYSNKRKAGSGYRLASAAQEFHRRVFDRPSLRSTCKAASPSGMKLSALATRASFLAKPVVDHRREHVFGDAARPARLVDHEHTRPVAVASRMRSATGSGASHRRSTTRAPTPWRHEAVGRREDSFERRCRSPRASDQSCCRGFGPYRSWDRLNDPRCSARLRHQRNASRGCDTGRWARQTGSACPASTPGSRARAQHRAGIPGCAGDATTRLGISSSAATELSL